MEQIASGSAFGSSSELYVEIHKHRTHSSGFLQNYCVVILPRKPRLPHLKREPACLFFWLEHKTCCEKKTSPSNIKMHNKVIVTKLIYN
jgi:hypothetical protein